MKKKLKDLTINEIIEIAKEHNCICGKCPLYEMFVIKCNDFCDLTLYEQLKVEQELEKEIENE